MKIRKLLAVMMVLVMTVIMIPNMTAHAASDVDFTIVVDTDISYISGDTIATTIQINNQTDKGYVEMKLFLTFDPDALNCLSIFQDVDGFSTSIEERDGQTGLLISYVSPDGQPSVKGIQNVKVEFAVITGVASGDYTLSLKVLECWGFDEADSKSDAVQKDGVLTLSMAKDKKLTIVETNDNSVGNGTGDGSSPNYYYTEPSVTQEVDKKDGGGASVGGVLLMIFGAIVVFAAGVVVGFILCQKRMLEDGYERESEDYTQRNYSGSRSRFGDLSSGSLKRSVYDEDEESADDYYSERLSGKKAPSRRPSILEDDSDIDTSYFGRAAETQLGSRSSYEEDDEADDFTPRRYSKSSSSQSDEYGSFDFLGSHKRERDDDGYGSFSSEDYSDDDDDDDGGYYSDRRRYR